MARLIIYDPLRLTYTVLKHTDWEYIRRVALENRGRQLHGRCLRIWRWEKPLYTYDEDWQITALDKDLWNSALNRMALWRMEHR